jgi:hypothetical protein
MHQHENGAANAANETGSSRSTSLRALFLALLVSIALVLAGTASASDRGDMAAEAGLGLGSVVTSLLYGPVKVVYATGGVIVGGLAFLFSGGDTDVASVVWGPSVRGDYVITPDHLRGERTVEFIGREPDYRADSERLARAPDPVDPPPASW